jgi:hypothetical protein
MKELLKYRNQIVAFLLCVLAASGAFAAQVTGTVINGTTNKPSSGDEVVLLSLATGMDEVARTKTDSQGHYSLNLPDERAQYLVRVSRQSVHYSKPLPPGTTTADITVYDAETQLENITTDARVFQLEANNGSLEISDRYIIKNESQPPRSRIGNQTFSVTLPDGAGFDHASITGPSGMPLAVSPVPSEAKNHYAFDFPIRPGETRFEVFYKIPYNGKYEFSLIPETPLSELGVLLPKSMKFTGISTSFAQDSDEGDLSVFFAKNLFANQPVKFSVSDASGSVGSQGSALWYIIGGIVGVIIGLALVLWRKAKRGKSVAVPQTTKSPSKASKQPQSHSDTPPGDMLDVLKDELFQLETDRLNGKISVEDYEKTKAGLDTLMRRQMSRK